MQLDASCEPIPRLYVLADKTFWKAAGLCFRDRKRLGVVRLREEEVLPTRGSQAALELQRGCGGSLARELCLQHEKRVCQYGEACKKIHRVASSPRLSSSVSEEGLTPQNCAIQDPDLRNMFWKSITNGDVRIALPALKEKLLVQGCSEEEMLLRLASELQQRSIIVLAAAENAVLATEWSAKDWSDREAAVASMREVLAQKSVQLLFSPVLRKPPHSFLKYMLNYLSRQQVNSTATHLGHACQSTFALEISSQGWRRLAKEEGYLCSECRTNDGQALLRISRPRKRDPVKWAPRTCTKQRQADLESWMISFDQWPSMGVLLESVCLFGPEGLRSVPLPKLYNICREVVSKSARDESDWEEGVEEEGDEGGQGAQQHEHSDEEDWEDDGSDTSQNHIHADSRYKLFPPPSPNMSR